MFHYIAVTLHASWYILGIGNAVTMSVYIVYMGEQAVGKKQMAYFETQPWGSVSIHFPSF
jgi:hypothetical protein